MSGSSAGPEEITALLRAVEAGDGAAVGALFERLYGELREIARRQLRAAPPLQTLDTTGLVHETYLKLSGGARWSTRDRYHFYALTAQAMRRVLVDHARRRTRHKRGGRAVAVELDDAALAVAARGEELLALDQALARLAATDAELAQLVEWRFFAGLSVDEIADLRGVTDRTVKRHWRLARAFLLREMSQAGAVP
jgi:RNA polymerase sigma factor (TIGR02999 family)